jgi:putative transport protein
MYSFTLLADAMDGSSIASELGILALAVTLGLVLGAIRVRGIRLGVSGVLFSALVFGQLGWTMKPEILDFLRDSSLVIFVYAIGLQVGPGFISSLRDEGLRLNVLSLLVVLLGAVLTFGIARAAHLPASASSGLYTGAFTTTPGLGAAQEAIHHKLADQPEHAREEVARAGLAYTVTYPFGIIGPILCIVWLRKIFGVNIRGEAVALMAAELAKRPATEIVDFEVTSQSYSGVALKDLPPIKQTGVFFSRMLRDGALSVPTGDTQLRVGDHYRALGTKAGVAELVAALGRSSTADLDRASGDVKRLEFIVTRTDVLRRPLRDLELIRRAGVTITRVDRAGIELFPTPSLRLQFGDQVTAIGPDQGMRAVERVLGNSPDVLNRPQLIPIFVGIVLGVLIGTLPIAIPGLNVRVRIGLSGGPMLAAIVLSQWGNIGKVVWYMPTAANQLFRDFGLAVFLACVGLQSGDHFLERLHEHGGIVYIVWGAIITVAPMMLVAIVARVFLKMNFITLSGLLAGAMTSLPALLFADEMAGSDAPSLAYAAVAPLALLMPIICAQLLAVLG